MDLRIERTQKNIREAFLRLRAKKPIEKITVKELSEMAYINKATFYLHYKDIYDLSDKIENDLLFKCISTISVEDFFLEDGCLSLFENFTSESELFTILFSGSRIDSSVRKIDKLIKEHIFKKHPELKDDLEFNIKLSTAVYGCYHAFFMYRDFDADTVITKLGNLSAKIMS